MTGPWWGVYLVFKPITTPFGPASRESWYTLARQELPSRFTENMGAILHTHTHTHTRVHTQMHTRIHTHTRTYTRTRAHRYMLNYTAFRKTNFYSTRKVSDQVTHIPVKDGENFVIFRKYTSESHEAYCAWFFLMYVETYSVWTSLNNNLKS